jgi:hypothetical protein
MNANNKHSMTTRAKAYAEAYAKAQKEKKMKEQKLVKEYTVDQFNMEKGRSFALASLALMGSAVFIIKNPLWTQIVQIWYLVFAFKLLDSLNTYRPEALDNVIYTWIIERVYGRRVKVILEESDDDEEEEDEDDEDDEEEEEDHDDPTDEDYVDKPVIKRPSPKKKATHDNNIAKEMNNDIHIVETSDNVKTSDNVDTSDNVETNDNVQPDDQTTSIEHTSEPPSQEPETTIEQQLNESIETILSIRIPDAEDYIMAERLSN